MAPGVFPENLRKIERETKLMCYDQTKFVKNEVYMERFHGNGLKNLNSAVILKITRTKKKFGARGSHKESFLKNWAQSEQPWIFLVLIYLFLYVNYNFFDIK